VEALQRGSVPGDPIVGIMARQLAPERAVLLRDREVPVRPAPAPDGPKRPSDPVLGRLALDDWIPSTRLAPIVSEAKEVESLRSAFMATMRPRPPERYETSFLRVEFEPVLRKPFRKHLRYSTRVVLSGKDEDGIVRKADEGRRTPQSRLHDVLEPLVQHLMEVDVREQW
jgi:hypothetical protein